MADNKKPTNPKPTKSVSATKGSQTAEKPKVAEAPQAVSSDVEALLEANKKLMKKIEEMEKNQEKIQKELEDTKVSFKPMSDKDRLVTEKKRESKKRAILKKWEEEPKVRYVINPVDDEVAGESKRRVQVNGATMDLPVGVQLDLPESVVDLLVEKEEAMGRLKKKTIDYTRSKEGVSYKEALG